MNHDRIKFALATLEAAARGQGANRYDHAAALIDANITERGDDLTPLAIAWCDGIPTPYRTLIHYQDAADPSGFDMSEVFKRALWSFKAKHEVTDRNALRLAAIPTAYLAPAGGEECARGHLTTEVRSLLAFLTEEIHGRFPAVSVPENAIQLLTVHHLLNDDIHGFLQAVFNAKSARRRRLTRAEKIAASEAAGR